MPLSAGTRLGPYEILSPMGAGGMGEVYRARDTKLDRDVAIKILPAALAQDPERLARFEREAKVLASLNHPGIAQIYGVEDPNNVRALVMELVPGETLKGPLPLETALNFAKQIAEALEAAHEKGIIHRDLKPANIITADGVVKVLDFGLAAIAQSSYASDPLNSPTLTMSPTRAGMILGTAAYMAPEQVRGQAVDRRADIWAFGCVLYELITGKPAFQGESMADIMSAVLKTEPDLSMIPALVRKLVARCLTKDRKQRLQAVGEARIAIDEALSGTSHDAYVPPTDASPKRSLVPWVVGTVALAFVSIGLGIVLWRAIRPAEQPLMRLRVDLGPDAVQDPFTTATLSPDGARLAFSVRNSDGKQLLATRLLSEIKPALLSGTDNGTSPFFSPEGNWIGFFADGKMKKISVRGGAPAVLCGALDARGASWGDDGTIFVGSNTGGLFRLRSEGGTPQRITKLQGGLTHRWPQALPGGEAVLFTIGTSIVAFEDASIAAVSLKTGEVKILMRGGYFGRYVPSEVATGHLLYVHEGVLFAVPFDPARLEIRGIAVPLIDDVAGDPTSGAGQFSFARSGNLIYRVGKVPTPSWPLSWLDHSGKTQPLIATQGFYLSPRFSPDGQKLAMAQVSGNDRRILIHDLHRGTISPLALDVQLTAYPTWNPDGKHISFRFSTASGYSLGWIRADGAGETQHLLDSKNIVTPYSFFPDGRRLAFYENDPESGFDLWTLSLDMTDPDHPKPGKPEPFLRTQFNECFPAVSPDGHWIAYASDESGRFEVYVRPFPGPGGKWQISNTGGTQPIWSSTNRELFFQNLENRIMDTDYEEKTGSFAPGQPRLWSDQQLHDPDRILNYDLAPDGKRFAILPELKRSAVEQGDVHVTFLLNFFDELRRRVPVTK